MNRIAPCAAAPELRPPFVLRRAVAALAGIGLLTSASVWAQDAVPSAASDQAVTTITVTGVRRAAQSAQTIKQNAEQVLDSIVAEDIGKFPDKNVAEILGRVTGVQVIRQNGEAGNVIIRGLGGVVTLFNGREMFTAAGRSLFLADVPVAMLQRVDVYKSQGSDMVEGGTAGVIDVRTNRPFDFKGAQAAFNGRVEHRDKSGANDPNLSGMLSNRWQTSVGEFGILGGLSYQRGRYHDETAWVSPPMMVDRGIIGADAMGRVMGSGDRKRWAGNLSAQWRPNSQFELYAETFSTKVNHDSESVFFVGVLPNFNPSSTLTTRAGTNYLDTISNPNVNTFTLSSTQARRDYSIGHQGALGLRWDATPQVRVSSELVRTISNYEQANPILDTVMTVAKPISASVRNGGGFLSFPGTNMTDPKNWSLFALFDNHNHSEGRSTDWRGDVSWEPASAGFLKELSSGVRVARRDAQYVHELNGHSNAPNPWSPNQVKATSIPGLSCVSEPTAGNYGMNQFFAPCASFLLNNTAAVRQAVTGKSTPTADDPLSFFSDRETTTALYGKVKFGFDLGVPFDGSVGVRAVRSQQTVSGYSSNNGVIAPVTTDTTSTDVLPSLNLKAKLRSDLVARLAAGKTIQRAAFGDFNPGMQLHPSNATVAATGSAGNPNLKPQEGRNVDLALEWYFAPAGSLTGTLFNHDFKNFIRHRTLPETYDGVTYQVDRPYNATKGSLHGVEMSYQQFYTRLPGFLSGLGLQANATYMDGGLTEPDGTTNTFAGMSKISYNVVGLYESGAWSARLAYGWRDKFVDEYNYRATGYNLTVDPLKTLDASLSYKLSKNLTVTLDGSNLLDPAYHDYHGVPELPRDVRRYDRAIGLSLRWRN